MIRLVILYEIGAGDGIRTHLYHRFGRPGHSHYTTPALIYGGVGRIRTVNLIILSDPPLPVGLQPHIITYLYFLRRRNSNSIMFVCRSATTLAG